MQLINSLNLAIKNERDFFFVPNVESFDALILWKPVEKKGSTVIAPYLVKLDGSEEMVQCLMGINSHPLFEKKPRLMLRKYLVAQDHYGKFILGLPFKQFKQITKGFYHQASEVENKMFPTSSCDIERLDRPNEEPEKPDVDIQSIVENHFKNHVVTFESLLQHLNLFENSGEYL